MKKFVFILTALLFGFQVLAFSQSKIARIEYLTDFSKIKNSTSITFYGWDFRHLIFSDHSLNNYRDINSWIIPGWLDYFDKYNSGTHFMSKSFKKKKFIVDTLSIQPLVYKVDRVHFEDNMDKRNLSIDSIKFIVKKYNVTGEGLGLIIIADEVRKSDVTSTAFVTIFDITSKDVIYIYKITGIAGGSYGLIAFYGRGWIDVIRSFSVFYNELYLFQP